MEKSTGLIKFQLVDENSSNIPLSQLTTIKLTLYDLKSGSIINNRDHKDAKNINDVTVSSTGLVTWSYTVSDTIIVNSDGTLKVRSSGRDKSEYMEKHLALFEWTWASGTGQDYVEIEMQVHNLNKTPATS